MNDASDVLLPEPESQRLRTVFEHDVLHAEPEPEFDALIRVASHTFDAPIALLTLDPQRLWFASRIDLARDSIARRLAFDVQPLIRLPEPVVLEDLSTDRCFQFNPLVLDPPHLRSLACTPILNPGGPSLGGLAVIDTRPRQFSRQDLEALSDLAVLARTILLSRQRARDLTSLAQTDPLTRLSNRACRDAALHARFKHAERTNEPFALVALDLGGFSELVDRHGHAAGDEVLVETTRRMSGQIRGSETLAHIVGHEFCVLLRHGDQKAATALIQRLSEVVLRPITLKSGHRVAVHLRAGAAQYSPETASPAVLVSLADRRLAESKRRQPVDRPN